MRTILYLLRKEFIQIFRNKFLSKAIFAIPVVQMVILVPAVTFEISSIDLCVVDRDMSVESRQIISKLQGSEFFNLKKTTFSSDEAEAMLNSNDCDLVLHIPVDFGRQAIKEGNAKLMVLVNAINATSAQLSWAYMNGILRDYNYELIMQNIHNPETERPVSINTETRFWYNPDLNYKYYMLPVYW